MRTITDQTQLLQFFDTTTDTLNATVVMRTPVTMRKKDIATKTIENPFASVYKLQTLVVELNASYEDKVNEQLESEGSATDFKAAKPRWGERVNGFVNRNGDQLYLRMIVDGREGKPLYEDGNGLTVDYRDLKPFLPEQAAAYRQGTVENVQQRVVKLDNIIGITVNEKIRYVKC